MSESVPEAVRNKSEPLNESENDKLALMQKGRPVVGVTDAQDRLIGLLTVENLGEMMMIHSARPDAAAGPWGNLRR